MLPELPETLNHVGYWIKEHEVLLGAGMIAWALITALVGFRALRVSGSFSNKLRNSENWGQFNQD